MSDQPLLILDLSKAWSPEARAAAAEARRKGGGATTSEGETVTVSKRVISYTKPNPSSAQDDHLEFNLQEDGTYKITQDWSDSGFVDGKGGWLTDKSKKFTREEAVRAVRANAEPAGGGVKVDIWKMRAPEALHRELNNYVRLGVSVSELKRKGWGKYLTPEGRVKSVKDFEPKP